MEIFLVTDIGCCTPCGGIIAGSFDNRKDAEVFRDEVKKDYNKYFFGQEDEVGIMPIFVEKKENVYNSEMEVFLVTDIGYSSPCGGIIAGSFDNRKDAEVFRDEVKKDYNKYFFGQEDEVGIVSIFVGKKGDAVFNPVSK